MVRRTDSHVHSAQPLVWRQLAQLPQGRKAARVSELCRVREGSCLRGETTRDQGCQAHRCGQELSSYGAKVVVVDAPLALYRRYRPDVFSDVIGQDHVTGPLSHALDNNRVNHAYLFSGPRGCGKTTSARIMARALNCAKGPTATPCGECESCEELARGGPGSIDVIEIDAASHGGVDDARELRERAFFAPMKARYKVYIIDEAHMVSPQGFNALLKLVEEPPSHIRFIFATTEPDKVIGTIRSRTHHYPFRLVPPKQLGDYLLDLCDREGVTIEPTVVPLIVRAGAGSVRDSLSVLDQMIGGSGEQGVTYALATALLGYTPTSLLDETIDALAADDGETLFGVIEKVVDTGQDPRRFAEDLLHRLRDLVVVSAVPDAAARGLIELADDQADRLAGQVSRFGRTELTRAADIVSQGLTDMRGATAPRLLLELMCARILLPGLDETAEGLGARLDRVERRLSVAGEARPVVTGPRTVPPAQTAPGPARSEPAAGAEPRVGGSNAAAPASRAGHAGEEVARGAGTAGEPAQSDIDSAGGALGSPGSASSGVGSGRMESAGGGHTDADAEVAQAAADSKPAPAASPGRLSLVDVRQLWPGVLDRVKRVRRMTWILLSDNAQVKDVSDETLTISLTEGARKNFLQSGHDEILRQALIDELGVAWAIEAIIDETASGSRGVRTQPSTGRVSEPELARSGHAVNEARAAVRSTRTDPTGEGSSGRAAAEPPNTDVADDDEVIDDAGLSGEDLLARELGAQLIEDIRHD